MPARTRPKGEADPLKRLRFESAEVVEFTMIPVSSRTEGPSRVDVSAREPVPFGPSEKRPDEGRSVAVGSVEDSLAAALVAASTAGRWDVVAQLARELEARRLAATGVATIQRGRERR